MYLRPYRDTDFEAVYELDRACFAPRFRFSRAMMRDVVGAHGATILVACEADGGVESMLGFCAVQMEVAEQSLLYGYVATLDVAETARGRGVGRALMTAAEQEVGRAGAKAMWLHVYSGNAAAIALYERQGYLRVGQEAAFYGAGFSALVYRKPLSPSDLGEQHGAGVSSAS